MKSGSNFTERRRCFHILTSSRHQSPLSDIFDIWVTFKLQFRRLLWYISLSAILPFSSWKKALKERTSKFSGFPIFFPSPKITSLESWEFCLQIHWFLYETTMVAPLPINPYLGIRGHFRIERRQNGDVTISRRVVDVKWVDEGRYLSWKKNSDQVGHF